MEIDPEAYNAAFAYYLTQDAARRDVKAYLDQAATADTDIPIGESLTQMLAKDVPPAQWRIEDLWPLNGRVVLAAQKKTGKTTTTGNIVRALVDDESLFNRFKVTQAHKVALLDFEMSETMLIQWYRDMNPQNTDAVHAWSMRGQAKKFDIRNDQVRTKWASTFGTKAVDVLIIDCLGPIFAGLGINGDSNDHVGVFLNAIDELLDESGIRDCLLIHHMGHQMERSMGASRIGGWPDVEWKMVRERNDKTGETLDHGPRFFSALGRDVELEESELTFDKVNRRLLMADEPRNRVQAKAGRIVNEATEATTIVQLSEKRLKKSDVMAKMKSTSTRTRQVAAITYAVDQGWLIEEKVSTAIFLSASESAPGAAEMRFARNIFQK